MPKKDGNGTSEPYRTLRLIGLVRSLIDYATQLIATARMHAGTQGFAAFAAPFGTTSLKVLVARFRSAISRAAHLGRKLRDDAGLFGPRRRSGTRSTPGGRTPRTCKVAQAEPPAARETEAIDPELAHLPSVAQIAAEIRRHPIEHVIATICRDLCITPGHALWQELDQALAAFGVRLTVVPEQHGAPRRRTAKPHAPPVPGSTQATQPAETPPTRRPACTGPPAAAGVTVAA